MDTITFTQSDPLKDKIVNYWQSRSESFSELHQRALHDSIAERWYTEIAPELKTDEKVPGDLKILDIGCGTGFFSILTAKKGFRVTGIDLTPAMIDESKKNAAKEKVNVTFLEMDAEYPTLEEGSFDLLITRNLTWTLPHLEDAYANWFKLLKPDGTLLNFDGDYHSLDQSCHKRLPESHAHNHLSRKQNEACEDIYRNLPQDTKPYIDVALMRKAGFRDILVDMELSKRIYTDIDDYYNPVPMFRLRAKKPIN